MPQKPGHVAGKMLWMVPRYAELEGTLIRLGSILSDPENLETSLNLNAIPAIPAGARRDATPHVRQYVRSEMKNSDSALVKAMPNLPLLSAGLSGDVRRTDTAETTICAIDVKAEVFMPDKAFMQEALKHKGVIEHARKGSFGTRLYVIVGVATAGELTVKEKLGNERRAAAPGHLAAPGGAGEGEAGFEHQRQGEVDSELEVKNSCDFAYRLREFVYTRVRGLRDKGDYGENSMFSKASASSDFIGASGKPAAAAQKQVEELPKFLFFKPDDAAAPGIMTFVVSAEAA
ncbi:hypothetical protein JDV02_003086 [Purpureocillium takamizusanense]|uniref:Uncharacterized protein n=1 Tax=Purpureocillium takamizusanense TaxID=2060973 RepID=A0A9Q8V838_9HYPO|nr:uncharacterized protein JDV02_003086 [Purpureocillium takamizusanense]UNI16670.1 hypothetical protein JDV02_003086 [Purpureocillium takamizusanense]